MRIQKNTSLLVITHSDTCRRHVSRWGQLLATHLNKTCLWIEESSPLWIEESSPESPAVPTSPPRSTSSPIPSLSHSCLLLHHCHDLSLSSSVAISLSSPNVALIALPHCFPTFLRPWHWTRPQPFLTSWGPLVSDLVGTGADTWLLVPIWFMYEWLLGKYPARCHENC